MRKLKTNLIPKKYPGGPSALEAVANIMLGYDGPSTDALDQECEEYTEECCQPMDYDPNDMQEYHSQELENFGDDEITRLMNLGDLLRNAGYS